MDNKKQKIMVYHSGGNKDQRIRFMHYQIKVVWDPFKSLTYTFKVCLIITGIFFFGSCIHKDSKWEGLTPQDRKHIQLKESFRNIDHGKSVEIIENGFNVTIFRNGDGTAVYYNHPDSLLQRFYSYDKKDKLEFVVSCFKKGFFYVGKGMEYDKKGRLIEVVDYDRPFIFNLQDVFHFMEEYSKNHEIRDYRILRIYDNSIIDLTDPVWDIEMEIDGKTHMFTLDGKSGEVLRKIISPYPMD